MIGQLADGSLGSQQSVVKMRVASTLRATQDTIDVSVQRHVKNELALFERFL